MEKKFKEFVDKYQIEREKAVIIGVSGGPDSMSLLNLALKLLSKEQIVVVHANHGLRLEARWDENFVATVSEELGVRFESERLQLKTASEAEAREARYRYLEQVRLAVGANYILTGHHLNDQVETVLLSSVRGAGPISCWGMNEVEGALLRPLLSVTKKELMDYAKANHLRYHLDRSNFDIRYTRNRIRAKLIPQFLKINPRFLETVGRNAVLGQEMELAWLVVLSDKKKKIALPGGLDLAKLKKEPIFIQKALIKSMLDELLAKKEGTSSTNVQKVLDLLQLPNGKKTQIGNLEIRRGPKKLVFGRKIAAKKQETARLDLGKPLSYGGFVLKMTNDTGRATKNNILLPVAIGYNLTIRTWREGDRIKTKAGTKKIQDIFTDAKIPAHERRSWPIVVSGRKVLWLPRLAACEEAVSEAKKKIIKIEVRNERKK